MLVLNQNAQRNTRNSKWEEGGRGRSLEVRGRQHNTPTRRKN